MKELATEQQKKLLALARHTIAGKLGIESAYEVPDFSDEIFSEKRGAFVTLHIGPALRGCIGYITGILRIPDAVSEMALSAAFRDPRFAPLKSGEFGLIDIEISVLTPLSRVSDVSEIQIGRDGLVIRDSSRSGLLLPQVPVEQGWNLETYLQNLCFKAGMSGSAWKNPSVVLEKFSAQVFGEKERCGGCS